jgi:fibronectin-binding autotransporter adhesin
LADNELIHYDVDVIGPDGQTHQEFPSKKEAKFFQKVARDCGFETRLQKVNEFDSVIWDPERREQAQKLLAVGLGGGGALVMMKFGALPGVGSVMGKLSPSSSPAPDPPPNTDPASNVATFPIVSTDPGAAPQGSVWYREDLGLFRGQSGILGTLTFTPSDPTYGTAWALPIQSTLPGLTVLFAGLAKTPIMGISGSGALELDPTDALGVRTFNNTLDDRSGNAIFLGSVTATTYYGELDTATLDGSPFLFSTLVSGDVLYWNGTNWINQLISGISVTSVTSANAGIGVFPTTGPVVLTLGELTYGTLDSVSFAFTTLMSGQVLTYNGTNWVNATPSSSGVSSVMSANAGISASPTTGAVVLTLGELDYGTLDGVAFAFTTLMSGQVLTYNGTNWINATAGTSGVSSLNGLTGAVVITSPNSTINVTASTPDVEIDINLANPNTWAAAQTFTFGDLVLLQTSGGGLTTLEPAGTGGSNYTASLPENTGTIAELNLAQSWTALQTFANHISIGGATFDISSLSSGELIYYNGSNWVNSAELDTFLLDGVAFSFTSLTSGQVLSYNGSDWTNTTLVTGVSSVSNSDGSLTISPTTGAVVASLNVGHTNTWSVEQYFGEGLQIAATYYLVFQGTGGGLTSVIGANTSASNYIATLPANTGVVAELNLAQSWTALQTFGNDISFGGATLDVTSLTTNDVLQYNGTNWVNVLPTALGLVNSVSNSDGTLTISPTTGSVVASLNLAQANTWTATVTVHPANNAFAFLVIGTHGNNFYVDTTNGNVYTTYNTLDEGGSMFVYGLVTVNNNVAYGPSLTFIAATTSEYYVVGTDTHSRLQLDPNGSFGGVTTFNNTLDDGSGNLSAAGSVTATTFYGELDTATLDSVAFAFTSLSTNQVLVYNGTNWINAAVPATAGVTSLNGLTGALSITSPNSTINVNTSGSDVTVDINLGNANTWTATQTFGNHISFGGATLDVTSLTSGNLLQYNGSNWVNVTAASIAVVSSVSNSDGSLTISPTTGAVVASLNVGHANSWSAVQTFEASGIRLLGSGAGYTTFASANSSGTNYTATFPAYTGGVVVNFTSSPSTGDILYYNASGEYVSLGIGSTGHFLTVASGVPAWSSGAAITSVSNSDGSLTISPTTGAVVASLNVANANTWSALQTFDAGDFSFGGYGADLITSGAKGDIWYYNGTNIVNLPIGSAGYVLAVSSGVPAWEALSGVSVTSVTNSDGSLTISPTVGAVVASLNVGHSNTWTITQTFNALVKLFAATVQTTPTTLVEAFTSNGAVLSTDSNGSLVIGSSTFVGGGSYTSAEIRGPNNILEDNAQGMRSVGVLQSQLNTVANAGSGTAIILTAWTYGVHVLAQTSDNVLRIDHAAYMTGGVGTSANILDDNSGSGNSSFGGSVTVGAGHGTLTASYSGVVIGASASGNAVWNASQGSTSTPLYIGNSPIATLAVANTWTAVQSFTNGDLSLLFGSGGGNILLEAGGSSTSSFTASLPANTGTVAELNLAQSWTALQTFGNNISFGGATLDVTSLSTGNVLQYNGTNWVNVTVASLGVPWSSLTNPTGALSLTMGSTDYTTFSFQQTSQFAWTFQSSTITSGGLVQFISNSTALSGFVAPVTISISGINANNAVTAVGLEITVANTNATSGTNTALYLSASGATTANTAIEINKGQILSDAAQIWALKSNTSAALSITDGTNAYYTIDTRTGVTGVSAHNFEASNPTFASASGSSYNLVQIGAGTLTLSGGTNVTALHGLVLNLSSQPTVTSSSSTTVTTASTMYIAGAPVAGGSVTLTNAYALYVAAGVAYFGGGITGSGTTGALTAGSGILNTANSWTAAQTFTYGDLVLLQTSGGGLTTVEPAGTGGSNYTATLPAYTGGVVVNFTSSPSTGDILYYNSSGEYVSLGIGSTGHFLTVASGLPAWSSGAAITSVSNSDGSLTISPTTGAVVASLNIANANTWSALQTFDAGDFAFGGYGHDVITSGAKGDIWYYNGTNIVNLPISGTSTDVLGISGGVPAWVPVSASSLAWSALTNPTTTLALTMAAADTTTFTLQQTTQTGFTWTSSTLTSGVLAAFSLTGSSAFTGSLVTISSTSTGFSGVTMNLVEISSSGATTDSGVTTRGLNISVTNTNGTSGTNVALYLTASGATTQNYALQTGSGLVNFGSFVAYSAANYTAAGTTQGTATALTTTVVYVTSGGATNGVILPATIDGTQVILQNNTANSILVYPNSGANIDGGSTNASITLPTSLSVTYTYQSSTTTWWSTTDDLSGTSTITTTHTAGGIVTIALNLSNANTWAAVQTFGNDISFGGATLNVSSLASGNILQYNGTNWVNVTGAALPVSWSSLVAPTGTLALTMPAADTTTFTIQSTTQMGFTWTSSTLTSGALAAFSLTGSSAFTGSLLTISSTSTGYSASSLSLVTISSSGSTTDTGVTTQGLNISVTNTNGVSGTNVALYLSASGATTGNYALQTGSGWVSFGSFLAYSGANYTAAGTNQAGATAITTTVVYVTSGAATNGLILPTVPDGTSVVVQNTLSNAVLIYPNSGANIDGGSANASISLPAGLGLTYTYQTSTTTWWSTTDDVGGSATVTATHAAGGIVTVALNLSNANTWAAVQTFGNDISFGGATLSVSSLASGNILQYNGSNWVNVTGAALPVAWSSLAAPTGALSLTMPAADTTTFTIQSTTQTGFTWTSSTLTGGSLATFSLTGSSAFTGTLLTVSSTSTGFDAVSLSLVTISSSGINSNTGVTTQGLNISVANTNGTSGTNVGLYLAASGAHTANYALELHAGWVVSDVAQIWALSANTAATLQLTDGTNAYYTLNTQTGTASTVAHTFAVGTAITVASAAGNKFSLMSLPAFTYAQSGTTTVTTMNGLSLNIAAPVLANTSTSALTVTTASTLYIGGPPTTSAPGGGSLTITNANALTFGAASKIAFPSNTATAGQFTDGTNAYYTLNTTTGTVSQVAHSFFVGSAPTLALAAGSTYGAFQIGSYTLTDSATTTVTAIQGMMMYVGTPTIAQSGGAVTVTTASSVYIAAAPAAGTSVTITNAYALYVAAGSSYFGGGISGSGSVGALTEAWSNLTAPTGTLGLTMPAGDETTFTVQSTSQVGFTWQTSTLTTGKLMALISTSVALSGAVNIESINTSGSNNNSSVAVRGLAISATNSGTTSTNTGIYLNVSSASTNNAIEIAAGQILSDAAQVWALPSNTAAALKKTDGTNAYYTLNTQTATSSVSAHTFAAGSAPTIASAAGAGYSVVAISGVTASFSGTTTITAVNGLSLYMSQPTISNTSGSALTVTTASTVYIAGAPATTTSGGGSLTITNPWALYVAAGASWFGGTASFPTSGILLSNPAGSFYYTFLGSAITAARTITLPLITGTDTLATLGLAQTFSAANTFSSTSSSGAIQLTGAAAVLAFTNSGVPNISTIKWADASGSSNPLEFYDSSNSKIAAGLSAVLPITIASGYYWAVANTSATSDSRLKPDFQPYRANPLDELKAVRFGMHSEWCDLDGSNRWSMGRFIAAVAAETLPDTVVEQTPEGIYTVISPRYEHWIVGVIKAQQDEIEALKAEIKELRAAPKIRRRNRRLAP